MSESSSAPVSHSNSYDEDILVCPLSLEFPYAWGGPIATAQLRAEPEDFQVEEILGFEPEGEGEHHFLWVRKRGNNTDWVARQLARFANVGFNAVSYSGMKDRHAVTLQWFSVHIPGLESPDWSAFCVEGVEILKAIRHRKKLKRGVHRANKFSIRLRGFKGDQAAAEELLDKIAIQGVPNYFGEQRFGRNGNNLTKAVARVEAGQSLKLSKRDKDGHAMMLSALRSWLFNRILAERIEQNNWQTWLEGDVATFSGSRSQFAIELGDADVQQRLQDGVIHPTGPLWGAGEPKVTAVARKLETDVAGRYTALAEGIESAGLSPERRALRLIPEQLHWDWETEREAGQTDLLLSFLLPVGTFATSMLREVARWDSHFTEAEDR
ncbi:tRNA pseudouridine(13) synthase TruD [Oceanospirillum sp.]|uniref:tRNA pseudouridine(13) synthase TruD n=1 Tax=Oceanospirillum sp. TaxID=2021254 RepID=UPI003A95131E